MRPQIEKLSDAVMRFFTPELYMRFNSSNDEEADRANQAWEEAIQEYQRHLNDIWNKLPSPARKLTQVCLHDADILACQQDIEPLSPFPFEAFFPAPHWWVSAVLSLKSGDQIVTLIYGLWDRLREYPSLPDWPFSKERKQWLYDEVDAVDDHKGMLVHRVLFSDGSILEIPFVSVLIHRFVPR